MITTITGKVVKSTLEEVARKKAGPPLTREQVEGKVGGSSPVWRTLLTLDVETVGSGKVRERMGERIRLRLKGRPVCRRGDRVRVTVDIELAMPLRSPMPARSLVVLHVDDK